MTWWRPNYYLVFDEESVHHPSAFRRCMRYLFNPSQANADLDPVRHKSDTPSIQDNEVDEYLEKVPLLDSETDQETDVYEDQSPTPRPRPCFTLIESFMNPKTIDFDEKYAIHKWPQSPPLALPTRNWTQSPPLDLQKLTKELKELKLRLENEPPDDVIQFIEEQAKRSTEKPQAGSQRPFKCIYCDKTFWMRVDQEVHTLTHMGMKQYECSYPGCPEYFKTLTAWTVHTHAHRKTNRHSQSFKHRVLLLGERDSSTTSSTLLDSPIIPPSPKDQTISNLISLDYQAPRQSPESSSYHSSLTRGVVDQVPQINTLARVSTTQRDRADLLEWYLQLGLAYRVELKKDKYNVFNARTGDQ